MVGGNASYVPERGDIVWISLTPHAGHKQASRRPAIVPSPGTYNKKSGLALFCPITSRIKGYPFEVAHPDTDVLKGLILADRIKSLDWHAGHVEFVCRSACQTVDETLRKAHVVPGQKD